MTYQEFINQDEYISVRDIEKYGFNKKIEDVKKHNKEYIERKLIELKDYFDNIYKGIDDNIYLDKEQRIAILTDEDYNMIIAGAGSGKTTTMSAKVKYLVEIKKVEPKDIILISYTNKAVLELKERINEQFKIPVLICTFHKFGIDVLKQTTNKNIKVLLNGYNIISDYFSKNLSNNNKLLKEFLDFFIYYFEVPSYALKFKSLDEYHKYKKKFNFTLKGKLNDYNKNIILEKESKNYTILNEYLNDIEEVMIANFLYLNGIDYDYQKPFTNSYTPDFTIYQEEKIAYLEHFNDIKLTDFYSRINNIKYKLKINNIRKIHNQNKTNLIEIYSNENLLEDLKKQLINQGFILKPRSNNEIFEKLFDESKDIYYTKFILFCLNFIQSFKINGFSKKSFTELKSKYKDKRNTLFLDFVEKVYDYYEEQLKINNYIDFEDMINLAYTNLEDCKLNYKYIIIDEYQDISSQRFNLAKKVSEISNSKIIVVGDDWQAIFAFAGSDISLFTSFKKLMGYSSELKITNTYRNSQELIDIAGKFIMQNDYQIKKSLKSLKKIDNPIIIYAYDDTNNKNKNKLDVLDKCLQDIIKENNKAKILFIGRYNFEKNYLLKENYYEKDNKLINKKYPNLDITFLSAHSSKGLGFDYVIILNAEDNIYGFPSQIKDDPIMKMVLKEDTSYLEAEERRLFYVALTRTKNKTYILAPISNCSSFVLELMKYPKIKICNDTKMKLGQKNNCPFCKFPLNKKYDLKISNLYVCSNEKELCTFKTNNLLYKKNIINCPKCKIGQLIVKNGKKHDFLGCTNYKNGCTYVEKIYK